MMPTPETRRTSGQPPLAELMGQFLNGRTEAVAAGFATERPGEVELHEAVPVQAVDPKQAWDEATAVLKHYGLSETAKAPADWPALVVVQPSHTGLAFAAGNYPQMVRDLAPLYRAAESLGELPTPDGQAIAIECPPSDEFSSVLIAIGTMRLARQWDAADALLRSSARRIPAVLTLAWANEEAAILWHRGRREDALRRWRELPESVPVLFNRGMAALFTGRAADARADLRRAVEQLPDSDGWHHLGRLYLALAGG